MSQGSWAYPSPPATGRWQGDFQETPSLNLTWAMPLFALLVFGATKAYHSIKRQVCTHSYTYLLLVSIYVFQETSVQPIVSAFSQAYMLEHTDFGARSCKHFKSCVASRYCAFQGLRRTWHEFCDSVWNWRDAAAGQPAPHHTAISKRRRFEAVSKVVQQLPVELHASEEDLRRMSLPELKVIGYTLHADVRVIVVMVDVQLICQVLLAETADSLRGG